jgi:hypothetical protein
MQPLGRVVQNCLPPPPHCVPPAVQTFVQHDAEPAVPVHAPFVQAVDPEL